MSSFRIAAIDFLNPAPLMWNFEHAPKAEQLARRYSIQKMMPAQCAQQLANGQAELGLIPIAAYATLPGLAIVPGCAIASLGAIRSILLVLRDPSGPGEQAGTAATGHADIGTEPDTLNAEVRAALARVRSIALDTSSRTSAMYTRILFQKYWQSEPTFRAHPPDLESMLRIADAALLIGDPALYALEARTARAARTGERLLYLDLGQAWHVETGLPWVSAFWATRSACFTLGGASGADYDERRHTAPGGAGPTFDQPSVGSATWPSSEQVVRDLAESRDAGLANLPALTAEWCTRLGLPASTVHTYLGHNIHYHLDAGCLAGIERFYADATECGLIARPPALVFL